MKTLTSPLPLAAFHPPKTLFLLIFVVFALSWYVQGAVVISEFMASNSGLLEDEDGDSSDWIEIHNDSWVAVDLTGWHLTDSASDLTAWTFPATNLPPDGYMIVFASGKDRAVAGAPLHTNFKLSAGGEYLALVMPDGVTISQAYSPIFPPQQENISYGLAAENLITTLVAGNIPARVFVPSNSSLGLTWTLPVFNDAAWMATNTPVGFVAGPGSNALLSLDFNERALDPATNTEPGFTSFIINSNTSATAIQTAPTVRTFGGISVTVSNTAGSGYDDRLRATPVDAGALTNSLLLRDFIFATDNTSTNGLNVVIAGLAPNQAHRITVWSFDSGSAGDRVSDWSGNGGVITNGYTFNGSVLPTNNSQDTFSGTVVSDGAGQIVLAGRRNPASSSYGVFLNALTVQSLAPLPVTNPLAKLMLSNNASAFVRIPFVAADSNAFQTLLLRIKYDDGFVAYINGQMVASRNAPASPQWNSTATLAHPDSDAVAYEDIKFASTPGLLFNGTNILAIQGLNVAAADFTFSVSPQLQGITNQGYVEQYFEPATPGADNGTGYPGLVEAPSFSVPRGYYNAPFDLTLASTTPAAAVYFTTNGDIPTTNSALFTNPIAISGTALVRAAAFFPGYLPSASVTYSYMFLSQVLRQASNPAGYPTLWQGNYPADYGMDTNITLGANYGNTISNDLQSIPTISLVTDFESLWNQTTGIYVNATQSGDLWERPASVEMFEGTNQSDFQVNCGVQMQGNAGRDNARTPKHSFRFVFKSQYGPGKLDYPLFTNSAITSFNTFTLRSSWTDNWATRYSDTNVIPGTTNIGLRYRPEEALNMRDAWVKDSQRAMGGWLATESDYVHLYVNGLYWGIYNDSEHMDVDFITSHLGGSEDAWDMVVGDDNTFLADVVSGSLTDWEALMSLANAGITNEASYAAITNLVDIDNLIDYMTIHIFAEVEDWPQHNWYAAHRHAAGGLPATKWIMLTWDQDIALDHSVRRNRIDVNNSDTPARLYAQLRAWPEFRREFGDRIQKHFFNGGALTPSNNIARLMARAGRIDRAIVGDSARWGDARKFPIGANPGTGVTFTRDDWWVPELQQLYTNYFVTLTDTNLARFRAGNLYPALSAPVLNQFGGAVPIGFTMSLSQTNTGGIIYYTLDGSDPRVYGSGAVAAGAVQYAGPVTLTNSLTVQARVLSGTNWSAIISASFKIVSDYSKLQISELYYNPPKSGGTDGDQFEFLEFRNTGSNTLDLSGFQFTDGITFTFSNGVYLTGGGFYVIIRDPVAFGGRFPGVAYQGIYTGKLDNSGERITVLDSSGNTLMSFVYGAAAPWPVPASGQSLQRINVSTNCSNPIYWAAAAPTPGAAPPSSIWDSDNDGMPDSYEIAHGLNPQVDDSASDPDGDGVSNLQEYLNETDPHVAQNFYRLGFELSADGAANILNFQTQIGKSYTVQQTSDLTLPNWTNSFVLTNVTVSKSVQVTNSISSGAMYYRLKIQ